MILHKRCEIFFRESTSFIYHNKWWFLALIVLFTAGMASQLGKLEVDTRDESFFHKTDPALIAYNNFRDNFGQDEIFVIALQPEQGLDTAFFKTLYSLHRKLEQDVPYLDEIKSLVNGRIVRSDENTLYVEELFPQPPQNEEETARIKKLIDQYPLYENFLISGDRSLVSIIIKAQAVKEQDTEQVLAGFDQEEEKTGDRYLSNAESKKITNAIQNIIDTYRSPELKIFFTGTPAVVTALENAIEHDLATIMPLSLLLIVFFLVLLYRRVSGVLYPLFIVLLSLVATFGFMGMARLPITLVSQILPSFLLIVGIADSVHILTIFYRNLERCGDKQQAIIDAVSLAGLPVLMTSLTTACGLLSFAWTDMATIAQLGWAAPVGITLALVYTIVLLPILIAFFPMRPSKKNGQVKANSATDRIFGRIAEITTHHPWHITLVFIFLSIAALYGTFGLRFSHNISTWFPDDAPIRISTDTLDAANGGSIMLEGLIDTGQENGLYTPEFLRRLDQAVTEVSNLDVAGIRAGKVWSLSDILKETNRALHGGQEAAYTLPTSRELVAQELMLFESSGSDDLKDFADSSFRTARFSIMAPFDDAVLYARYTTRVQEYLTELFPEATVSLTGKIKLFVRIVNNALTTMAESYSISLIIITLLMIIMVGRIKIGLLSMVANVTPILCILGLMGLKNIPLDLSTMLVGSIVLGIVVDDTIHFLHHFRRAFDETGKVELAVRETLMSTGRAMFITSMVLCGGFFIYMVGELANNIRFGMICGFAVIFALMADFFMVPALLALVYRKRT